jgi:hypothetical protein
MSYDCNFKKIGISTAVEKSIDEATSLKARVNNFGNTDLVLKSRLSTNLTAKFTTGGNISGFFQGKAHDEAYSGINFRLTF